MIACYHILIKHNKSRTPFDRVRNKQITRTEDEALEIIKKLGQSLDGKLETFQNIAFNYSECSSSKNGGDLGEFGKGDMQQSFEDAAYALKVGEVSAPVSSDSGIHIILRYK